MKHRRLAIVLVVLAAIAGSVLVAGTTGGKASAVRTSLGCVNVSCQQGALEGVTGKYMNQTHTAGWANSLLNQHGPTAEMQNLSARVTRLSDPNKIGYLYGLSTTGQVMAFWTVRGKVSSTGSQLTNTENRVDNRWGGDNGGSLTVASPGDDGTYGPEECQSQGVFAFTADSDALVEWCGPWMYADAPLRLTTAPLIVGTAGNVTTAIPTGGSTKK